MLVTLSPITTVLTLERLLYQGTFETELQLYISPVPLTVSTPVSVSSDQVRLSPHLPLYAAASAFKVKRSAKFGKSRPAKPESGAAVNSITAVKATAIALFKIRFILPSPLLNINACNISG